jgi:predicted nucleotidyltransferase
MNQEQILEIVREYERTAPEEYGIIRLGIFGSVARNEITEESDVDVVVELKEPSYSAMAGIMIDLEELLKRPVDIVRYRKTLHPEFKKRIDAEVVYV